MTKRYCKHCGNEIEDENKVSYTNSSHDKPTLDDMEDMILELRGDLD